MRVDCARSFGASTQKMIQCGAFGGSAAPARHTGGRDIARGRPADPMWTSIRATGSSRGSFLSGNRLLESLASQIGRPLDARCPPKRPNPLLDHIVRILDVVCGASDHRRAGGHHYSGSHAPGPGELGDWPSQHGLIDQSGASRRELSGYMHRQSSRVPGVRNPPSCNGRMGRTVETSFA